MKNATGQPACGLRSGVCPDCAGARLVVSGDESSCLRCGRRWPTRDTDPCPWPAIIYVHSGARSARVCTSHGALSSFWELVVEPTERDK